MRVVRVDRAEPPAYLVGFDCNRARLGRGRGRRAGRKSLIEWCPRGDSPDFVTRSFAGIVKAA